jgi:hypothetical protein
MEVNHSDFGIEDEIVISVLPRKGDIKIKILHEYDVLNIELSAENADALQTKISQALQDIGK